MFNKLFYRLWRLYRLTKKDYTLDIHVTEHCNLNCVSCNHYSPLAPPIFINLQELERNMEKLKAKGAQKLFKELHLLGGEPLLHPDIADVIRIVRTCFTADHTLIKLVTNGLLLKNMPESFWEACKKHDIEINVTVCLSGQCSL